MTGDMSRETFLLFVVVVVFDVVFSHIFHLLVGGKEGGTVWARLVGKDILS